MCVCLLACRSIIKKVLFILAFHVVPMHSPQSVHISWSACVCLSLEVGVYRCLECMMNIHRLSARSSRCLEIHLAVYLSLLAVYTRERERERESAG